MTSRPAAMLRFGKTLTEIVGLISTVVIDDSIPYTRPIQSSRHLIPRPKGTYTPNPTANMSLSCAVANSPGTGCSDGLLSTRAPPSIGAKLVYPRYPTPVSDTWYPGINDSAAGLYQTAAGSV